MFVVETEIASNSLLVAANCELGLSVKFLPASEYSTV